MRITFIKKIKEDGSPCRKCRDVADRLEKENLTRYITETLVADERDKTGAAWDIINENKIDRAPFFVVVDDNGNKEIFITYFALKKFLQGKGLIDPPSQGVAADVDEDTPDDLYLI